MKKTLTLTVATLLTVPTLVFVGTAPAQADDRERRGSCSGTSRWEIKAGPDDGRMEVEAEIDSNRSGQTWRWRLRHNGKLVAKGRSVTHGRDGSFEVERRTRNAPGVDSFRFRAVNRASGEVCVARVKR